MAVVIWSPEALDDLAAICEYIAQDAPRYADMLRYRVEQSVKRLEQFPRSGRVVPEFGIDLLREGIVRGYRVIYRLEGDRVEILSVLHGARLLGELDCE